MHAGLRRKGQIVFIAVAIGGSCALAGEPPISLQPLIWQEKRESVYAPPTPPGENEGVNEGAVRVALDVSYQTDYIWRGIERFEVDPEFTRPPDAPPVSDGAPPKEDLANLQVAGRLSFDLGKFPSPFVELFVNASEDVEGGDSSFQEIRPTVGFDWNIRPLLLTFAHTSYIFPESGVDANGVPESSEVVGRLEIDDSYFFRSEKPIFSPYVMAAFDYAEFDGTYIEFGVQHVWALEELPITLVLNGEVAYVSGLSEIFGDSSGFQHYQVGLTGEYSLNQLFNFSNRFGDWYFRGYINYTGRIDEDLRCNDQLWGGAGLGFRY